MISFLWKLMGYDSGISWLTTVLVFVCTFVVVFYITRRPDGIPPGPLLFPVIGNLPSLVGDNILVKLEKLRKRYGDIFGIYIGKELTIFLNGYDVIHEALVKRGSLLSHRPMSASHILVNKFPGVIFSNGNVWKEQRTFTLRCLRDVCFRNGGRNIEDIIQNELEHLVCVIKDSKGPVQLESYVHTSLANVISMVLYRKRFDFDDEDFNRALNNIRINATEFLTMSVMANCFPFLHLLPFDVLGVRRQLKRALEVREILWPDSKRKTNGTKHDHMESVTDLYMNEIASQPANHDSSFTEGQMKNTLFDVFGAGVDTTANTVRWAILHLVRNPRIQDKMFREIEKVVGLNSPPTVKDRQSLPYVEAVILEVMRTAIVTPLALPHSVPKDTIFHGFLLKENCTIVVNLSSCLKDPKVWDNPEEFRPERFLSGDQTTVEVPKEFIPFSIGPRSCLGETIARVESFLYMSTLIQTFKFLPEEEGKLPEAMGHLGLTWRPGPYLVRAVKRKTD